MRTSSLPKVAVLVSLAAIGLPHVADAGLITFSDATFLDADWSVVELRDDSDSNSFVFTGVQKLVGGNPDAYRSLTQAIDEVPPELGGEAVVAIQSGHTFLPGTFDPGEDGTFLSLDFAFDIISIESTAGAIFYGLMAIQDGHFFAAIGANPTALNGTDWHTTSQTGVLAVDFSPFDLVSVLDLSDSGSPVKFGFFASNGTFGLSFNEGGADNWVVRISTREVGVPSVPEPGSLLIVALGLAGLVGAGRARQVRGT